MDELNNGEQGQYVEPGKNEKKNNTRNDISQEKKTQLFLLSYDFVLKTFPPLI